VTGSDDRQAPERSRVRARSRPVASDRAGTASGDYIPGQFSGAGAAGAVPESAGGVVVDELSPESAVALFDDELELSLVWAYAPNAPPPISAPVIPSASAPFLNQCFMVLTSSPVRS
jgi:hypothetical protein